MNYFQRYKKIFYLIGFLAVSILIGVLMWKTFFTGELNPAEILGGNQAGTGNLPSAAEGEGTDNQGGHKQLPQEAGVPGGKGGFLRHRIPPFSASRFRLSASTRGSPMR